MVKYKLKLFVLRRNVMADYCLCCGKKLGFFSGEHFDNTVCDNCYFKFAGYLENVKSAVSAYEVEERFEELKCVINELGFSEEGCKNVITHCEGLKKITLEQIEKNEKDIVANNEARERQAQISAQFAKLKNEILLTTSNNFEGYKVIEYCGVKSGTVVLGTGVFSEISASFNDVFGSESRTMGKKIESAKEAARNNLIRNCIEVSANGIIAIEYDIMMIGSNMIVVSANGTAVKIEKIEA